MDESDRKDASNPIGAEGSNKNKFISLWRANQMTDFYMKCNAGLNCVKSNRLRNSLGCISGEHISVIKGHHD